MKTKKLNYARSIKLSFLKSVLDTWTKRNHKLLHIGLNSGIEPSFFWDLGFDVTYLAHSPEDLAKRQEKNGQKIEYYLGKIDHLPFDEKVFDYTFSAHNFARFKKLEKTKKENKEQKILDELYRVSAQGICLLENNSLLCPRLKSNMSSLAFQQLEKYLVDDCQTEFFSALHGPTFLWTKKFHLQAMQAYPLKSPFGSLMALRIATSTVPLTTLTITSVQPASDL